MAGTAAALSLCLPLALATGGCCFPRRCEAPIPSTSAKLLRHWELRYPGFPHAKFNPSGLWRHQGSWLVVSDKKDFPNIYRLKGMSPGALEAETFLELKPSEALGGGDLEGLAFCRGRFLIVEEGVGAVIEVDGEGRAASRRLDLQALHEERGFAPAASSKGAGLEGIACDEADGAVYVATEREHRMIYALEPGTLKPVDFFDVPGGWELPRFIAQTPLYPDYADLFFSGGFLYALQRNSRQVLKIDPRAKTLLAVLTLQFREEDFYDYSKPFGMAEGLYLSEDRVYVLLDNNDVPRRGEPANSAPLLLEFARPAGF